MLSSKLEAKELPEKLVTLFDLERGSFTQSRHLIFLARWACRHETIVHWVTHRDEWVRASTCQLYISIGQSFTVACEPTALAANCKSIPSEGRFLPEAPGPPVS